MMRLYFLILIIAVSGWAKDITIDTDMAQKEKEYRAMDLTKGDGVKTLKDVAATLPKTKEAKALRREIKTKLALLGETSDALDDVQAYIIPAIKVEVLDTPVVEAEVVVPVIARASMLDFIDRKYIALVNKWDSQLAVAERIAGVRNMNVVPHPATLLGRQRKAMLAAITVRGWTPETEALWANYYAKLNTALARRNLR